jgi:hypothetical protein
MVARMQDPLGEGGGLHSIALIVEKYAPNFYRLDYSNHDLLIYIYICPLNVERASRPLVISVIIDIIDYYD